MKKVLSILVACAAALSINVATFAADDTPGIVHRSSRSTEDADSYILTIGVSDYTVGEHELILVDDTKKMVGGVYNKLDPDEDYTFHIYYNAGPDITNENATTILNNPNVRPLSGKDLDGGTIRLRTLKGSSYIQSAKIRTIGRNATARYELRIETRGYYGTKINDVEYSLNVTGSGVNAADFKESTHAFEVGWETISDDETDVGEDGIILISNDYPVITKDQFVDIAKSANYKNVTFEAEDGGWIFTGRVSGMGDTNFYFTYDVIPEIINKLPDQEYKFLTFKAGVTFPTNGEMRIDTSDISDDFTGLYTYLYRNGRLTRINTTFDSGADEIVFRTNYLGAFVITDQEITDTTILADGEDVDEDKDTDKDIDNENPQTGAAPMDMAAIMGLLSLVSGAAIPRKKK